MIHYKSLQKNLVSINFVPLKCIYFVYDSNNNRTFKINNQHSLIGCILFNDLLYALTSLLWTAHDAQRTSIQMQEEDFVAFSNGIRIMYVLPQEIKEE